MLCTWSGLRAGAGSCGVRVCLRCCLGPHWVLLKLKVLQLTEARLRLGLLRACGTAFVTRPCRSKLSATLRRPLIGSSAGMWASLTALEGAANCWATCSEVRPISLWHRIAPTNCLVAGSLRSGGRLKPLRCHCQTVRSTRKVEQLTAWLATGAAPQPASAAATATATAVRRRRELELWSWPLNMSEYRCVRVGPRSEFKAVITINGRHGPCRRWPRSQRRTHSAPRFAQLSRAMH